MSILHSLLRFVDVIEFRRKQQERRQARKKRLPGRNDDIDFELPPERPPREGAPRVCRVCGDAGGPEQRFCPRCLAETMERRR